MAYESTIIFVYYVRVGSKSKNGKIIEPRRRSPRVSKSFYVEINLDSISDILMVVNISDICYDLCSGL